MAEARRSWEFAAVPLTLVILGILGVLMWAFAQGLWVWVGVGIVILGGLIAAAVAYMARPHHPAVPSGEPVLTERATQPAAEGVRRVLVIADDACAPDDLGVAIAGRRGSTPTEAFVIAPVLGSRMAQWTSDERAYVEAGKHLDATVAALSELNVPARGHVGSHDPLQAIDDGLRECPADEIVLAVHPAGATNWLEDGVVEGARARSPVPVTVVTVPSPAAVE